MTPKVITDIQRHSWMGNGVKPASRGKWVAFADFKAKADLMLDLLQRAADNMEDRAPDARWLEEYFGLTGEHMILTDEGWEPGEVKPTYQEQALAAGETDANAYIYREVNAARAVSL